MVSAGAWGPVPEPERIDSLDVLRGVALLGILATNIQHYAMFAGVVRRPDLYGDLSGANFWAYALTFTFIYQKFLPLFAMLFGAGIVLAAARREMAGLDPAAHHYRRMAVLALIGLIHAYLIWYGDILLPYALCGAAVYLLRRLPPRTLLTLGLVVLAGAPVIRYGLLPTLGLGGGGEALPIDERIAADLSAYRGPWSGQLRMRAAYAWESQTLGMAVFLFWRGAGCMLLGMGLFKLGVLGGKVRRQVYAALLVVALLVGVPVTALALWANVASHWQSYAAFVLSEQVIYWVGIVVTLGWIGTIMLAWQPGGRWSRPLAAVGRMALSNYLAQSLLCTALFYGHGLGLYGSVPRTGLVTIVAAVWLLQLVLSPLWLRRFRFGPAEWLWRCLTYGKLQAMLRRAPQ